MVTMGENYFWIRRYSIVLEMEKMIMNIIIHLELIFAEPLTSWMMRLEMLKPMKPRFL